ncbi:hypothetical protein SUGI_1079420 [Cryptomeria japonica]|nr:hypothetical protein SUGI_1079420 [Cryptomeria japonica]
MKCIHIERDEVSKDPKTSIDQHTLNMKEHARVGFIQCGFPHVPNGHTGEDGNTVEKATSIFTRTPKPISGGLIQMFSSAPINPGKNTGSSPQHDDKPGSKKGTGKPAKDS